MYLDAKSSALLRSHARRLYETSTTMDTWQKSEYGSFLTFCDAATLADVRTLWEFYGTEQEAEEQTRFKQHFDSIIEKAKAHDRSGGKNVITGVRSVIPAHEHASDDMCSLHQHYWEFKSSELNLDKGKTATHPNPTFLTVNDEGILHYGTDPLLGFHLATAYAPLPGDDPTAVQLEQLSSQREKIVAVARMEFEEWLASYRKRAVKNIRIRFFAGDAISLAHTLQHKCLTGENTAQWYRYRYGLQPVTLDGPDYAASAFIAAPLEFDVIETSNLCDHMGPLILLTATSPLLRNRTSSTLYTETLIRYNGGKRSEAIGQHILCGHLPTMTTLLGLFPIEYWTNTSSTSVGDETRVLAPVESGLGRAFDILRALLSQRRQMLLRTAWKRPFYMIPTAIVPDEPCPCPTLIQFDAKELARALYALYVTMFRDEEPAHADPDSTLVWYHRGSFAAFLRLVQTRVSCDWDAAMINLVELIKNRQDAHRGLYYIDELFVYMHIADSIPSSALGTGAWAWQHRCTESTSNTNKQETLPSSGSDHTRSDNSGSGDQERPGDIRDWANIPPIVCVTLKIPRSKIAVLTRMRRDEIGTPYVHCFLKCPGGYKVGGKKINAWHDEFAACQLAFGDVITTSGKPDDDSYRVSVAEDKAGWGGASALIAVFYVPAFYLLAHCSGSSENDSSGSNKNKAKVGFAITPIPAKEAFFRSKLGGSLTIYETGLDDPAGVYITRYAPNLTRFPIISGFAPTSALIARTPPTRANASMTASVDQESGHIVTFTGRLDITADDLKSALRDGHEVHPSIITPCEIAVRVGEREQMEAEPLTVSFPVFIKESAWRVRVARKSSWVEVIAHVGGPSEWMKYPYYMYPVRHHHLISQPPTNYNMPYLSLHACPVIDTRSRDDNKLDWLISHVSSMMSKEESTCISNKNNASSSMMTLLSKGEMIRLRFKESLVRIFATFSGPFDRRPRVFVLGEEYDGERDKDKSKNTDKRGKNKNGGRIRQRLLIFVRNLRMNRSDRAVVLDCAVIPSNQHAGKGPKGELAGPWDFILSSCFASSFYDSRTNSNTQNEEADGIIVLALEKEVMHLWRRVLPAYVERCRTWTHRETCEYRTSIPPVTESNNNDVSLDEPFLCACGNGVFPNDFSNDFRKRMPFWDVVAKKYAVRAAISPAFFCWAPPLTPTEMLSSPFPMLTPMSPFPLPFSFANMSMADGGPSATSTGTASAASIPAAALGTDTDTDGDGGGGIGNGAGSNQPASDQASGAETDGCACCGRKERQDNGGPLRECTGCYRVKYCSEACQRRDWLAYHKRLCRRLH